jgi:hypothetical protein
MHGTVMLIIRGRFEGPLRVQTIHACIDAFEGIVNAAEEKSLPHSGPKWPANLILGEAERSSPGYQNGSGKKKRSAKKSLR